MFYGRQTVISIRVCKFTVFVFDSDDSIKKIIFLLDQFSNPSLINNDKK